MTHSVIFFGSFQSYSAITLDILTQHPDISINAVVTNPPPSPVYDYCQNHSLPVLTPTDLSTIPDTLSPPDFIISAGYGLLLPPIWLKFPKFMAINLHPSLLPDYAGRFPVEWAILKGETTLGITAIKMSPKFDRGEILAQSKYPISPNDTKETLYHDLYTLAGNMTISLLPQITAGQVTLHPQTKKGFYARQLTREDGYLKWSDFLAATTSSTPHFDRLIRALNPWPGVWTTTPATLPAGRQSKRLKILSQNPLVIQIEGKKPALWSQISQYYT